METTDIRHTEKNILFMLLDAEDTEDFSKAANLLTAAMEPGDVAQVRKRAADYKESK